MTFKVDPDTHIDSLEKAEDSVLEGTSHWSCKIATTGQANVHSMEDGSVEVAGYPPPNVLGLRLAPPPTSTLPAPTHPTSATTPP